MKNNLNLEHHFHPGVFEDSKWSCCGNKSKMATGCNPTFINPNKQQPPSRDTRSQLPPLPSTPNFPGRTEDQELIAKRSASNPASLNGAVGTGTVLVPVCICWFVYLFVCLFVCLFICLFVCLFRSFRDKYNAGDWNGKLVYKYLLLLFLYICCCLLFREETCLYLLLLTHSQPAR